MTPPVRFLLVGAGAIAGTWVDAFADHDEATLLAVCDIDAERARKLAQRANCAASDNPAQALSEHSPDAVIICTPPVTHADLAIMAAGAGAHILCEKPLSVGTEDARRMIDAAEQAGVLLTMASKFRYVQDLVKAKSLVDAGILGEIVLFENAFTSRIDMSTRWNSNPLLSGGGVLIDNGTHSLDIMRYFLGPLEVVQVIEGKRSQGLAVEETIRLFAQSAAGVMGSIDLSWSINKELDTYVNIYGSSGTIQVGWRESKYRQHGSPSWVVFGTGYDKLHAFRSQVDNFIGAIRGRERLLITAQDGLASVQAVAAAYASLAKQSWTPIGGGASHDAFDSVSA